jgi:N-acetylglutamate synthase-like GNAT family acetyltransferase
VSVRPAERADRSWIAEVLRTRWGGTGIVLRGRWIEALELPALIVQHEGRRWGLATYELRSAECEIITLDALEQHAGVGTALLEAVAQIAREHNLRRLIVVTTNDNLDALRFYQRRGFAIAQVRADAIAESRRLKASIPATGCYGIPIRDEVELICTL